MPSEDKKTEQPSTQEVFKLFNSRKFCNKILESIDLNRHTPSARKN